MQSAGTFQIATANQIIGRSPFRATLSNVTGLLQSIVADYRFGYGTHRRGASGIPGHLATYVQRGHRSGRRASASLGVDRALRPTRKTAPTGARKPYDI